MPTDRHTEGFTYMACIDGEWKPITVAESPIELRSILESDEEWTRVRHGHWIEKSDFDYDNYYECSVCHEPWVTIEGTPMDNFMNYCPKCGAIMDEQVKHSID